METLRNRSIAPAFHSEPWAVWLPVQALASLGLLRLRHALKILPANDGFWLQGVGLTPDLELALLTIPGARRFMIDREQRLIPEYAHVPIQLLPEGNWEALSDFLKLESPRARVPAQLTQKVPWKLERSIHEQPANVLMLPLRFLVEYATHAPNVRLKALRMSVSDDGRVVLRGHPLPPLRGSWYAEEGGVAVPLGWALAPRAEPEFWRTIFGSTSDDLILLEVDGTHEYLQANGFKTASRSAIRATARGLPL